MCRSRHSGRGKLRASRRSRSSGNAVFDAYRAETLRRLEEEAAAFASFLARLRAEQDAAVFARFLDSRPGRLPALPTPEERAVVALPQPVEA